MCHALAKDSMMHLSIHYINRDHVDLHSVAVGLYQKYLTRSEEFIIFEPLRENFIFSRNRVRYF